MTLGPVRVMRAGVVVMPCVEEVSSIFKTELSIVNVYVAIID